jgi:hypothetical protein
MTTKRALLVSIIILAGVSLVGAQSPGPPPGASPEASASPAKKVRKKKAEASPAPANSPEASASPAKTRGRKKAETSPAPAASPEASASPAKTRGRKKAETSPAPAASPEASVSPAKTRGRKNETSPAPSASRRYQPHQQEVTLAKEQARHPPLHRLRQRLQPSRSRSGHYLSPNRQLVRQQPPPPQVPSRLMPHRHQVAATDWYGLIVTATSITKRVHVFTAKPSRVNI